ncbi:MAG: carboxypeptidase-like regulatory domain-containing protein [Ignavibacteriales bacterium]|nr:carboxypeptidase-like regulatory domain-containing protein [Ignavibacteriales bacterium]
MIKNFYQFISKVLIAFTILIFISFQTLMAADTGAIRGRVLDKPTKEALIGASLVISGTNIGESADINGKFFIRNVPTGKQELVISYIGYKKLTVSIDLREDQILERNFELEPESLVGQTIVVTAQAQGQLSAINQQLSSNTISNVVSAARIKELPDVNAAESIGRLPGVSIERSGGEATKVEIRGLSPKYNTVTVNGVRLPATGGDDRSVDLSLISSNILDGITVKKANTPDMDADALGGTVDLKLKEAPDKMELNVSLQGGYNQLQKYYGNYNFNGNISNRFFEGDLGLIASVNIDDYDRSADKFQGNYRQSTQALTGITQILLSSLNLREEKVKRGRTGASFLLDYRIPYGKVTANSFYNRLKWDGLYRINRGDILNNRHYYDLEQRGGTTSIFTGAIGMEQDFDWIKYDANISRTASRSKNPGERTWTFSQENAAYLTTQIDPDTPPTMVPNLATIDTNSTGIADLYVYDTRLDENESAVQLNVQVPFRLTDQINGYLKTGGKLRWLNRLNDQEQNGRNGLQYGGGTAVNTILTSTLKYLSQNYPDEFNWKSDSLIARRYGVFPISSFLSNYSRSDFMKGDYPLGFAVDEAKMNKLMDALFATGENRNYAIGSIGRDYDGVERYQAGYFMSEFNVTKYATVIGGVRWEKDYSIYNGQRFREVTLNNIQGPPADLQRLTIERNNEFWLPMIHLIINPTDWLKVRLARTETLTRPDYIQYAPITSINSYQNYIRAANSTLKPAKSANYDVAISVFENTIGLFSVSGFYKKIDDLIFQTTYYLNPGVPVLPGLNIPDNWLKNAAPQVDTYINNPTPATYKGVEFDWQTHFWYLPSVFNGLVLNINYTRIFSEIEKELFFNGQGAIIPGSRPPRRANILIDSSRVARMPDQPAHILNVTIGYDYMGFSARLSYLYQTNKVTYIDRSPALDNFSGTYARWDFTLQQKLDFGIQVFANFTNLNNRADQNFRGEALVSPTYIEYYGFTMDVGVRYKL